MSANTSQSDKTEPVDAEFEPVSDSSTPKPKAKTNKASTSGAGVLQILGIIVLSSVISAAITWALGRNVPQTDAQNSIDLQTRIAALETAGENPEIIDLQIRVDALEQAARAQEMRVGAFEQLVRDVAALRDQIADFDQTEALTPDEADIDMSAFQVQLDQALADINDEVANLQTQTETALSTAQTAQSTLQQVLASEAPITESASINLSALSDIQNQINTLQQSVTSLGERLETVEGEQAALPSLTEQIETLQQSVSDFETRTLNSAETRQSAPANLVERALSVSELAEAAATSQPFAMEYAMLSQIWPEAPGLERLTPAARTGAPTLSELAASFPGEALRQAAGQTRSWFGVIEVRRSNEDSGSAQAIESLLAQGELEQAVLAAQTLDPGEAQPALDEWLSKAENRLVLDRILDDMRSVLTQQARGGGQ